ncbi:MULTISPECIES: winged helix-turn-helix domain-containing protein [unclassified Methylophaga]|jgi:molybdate transport system regulatory protein|uniref:winged helix-turn-helix domain-containing protein n=1 Tax=unclassified Methylophaga TaxID=2629249 RepID=UPI000C997501|nr:MULTISPECIES: winged helix-turn-helix domain-containing protein [unclassified Methylophaga]MAK68055.1 ModE family transcriptional regulator [Methylophaga sp.]MAY16830.1 ModE family transcriptional regulator [Methylophaga sp.]HAO23765.1 ModE family transcriptional regulator [Methylophaga sp.]|tara:strand:- start:17422 stop:17769 length:348 start_codon:yes stop_codon:yes gene_type:complete
MSFKTSVKIRLHLNDKIALGPGKADLLEAIIQNGSISAAGRAMNMSYKRAWDLVNTMNESFVQPIVTTAKGGSHGGGAEVTELGKQVLTQYRLAQLRAEQAIEDEMLTLSHQLKN